MTTPTRPDAPSSRPFGQSSVQPLILSGRDVTAVLGPTNTGKTHLAIERLVAHESGVIGLPLRLLAREVYARVCARVGADKVALVTGEEKIQPPGARYFVCTVEAMPRETDAAFVAIDEVQLAGDLERGHIFTDRILNLRGRQETLLLGAATMRGILEKLLRGVSVVTRPRMSHLAYAGSKKLTRLPRRSAVVAFSADEVYGIAELIRRQRGGAAVVLGGLSPRTRNAQVELYQSGDVDYLVATDAIGMGLNLDVDHVAFAQNRKFDGFQYRELTAAELGQIAGRAGRHMRDGTFGVTGQVDPFPDELVERIESHDFEPVKVLQWRTAAFDFSSLDALRRSIDRVPAVEGLTRALPAVDARALDYLARDDEIVRLADRPRRVELLWEACALPDYRRIAPAQHGDIIGSIYLDLARKGHVDADYMAEQVRRADTTEGDIDTLSARIAQIRTWTFVSHRPGWLADPAHWQEKTREIEDRLSDALHERLTKRFVDRRTSVLMRRLRENAMLEAEIDPAGDVTVEGHHVGSLQGFRFTADQSAGGEDAKAVKAAAQKALAAEFEARAERFANSANGDFALASEGLLRWIGAPVATLTTSEDPLFPRVILLADEQLTGPARDKVAARAERFVRYQIETLLKPLVDLKAADQLSGLARGIAFQLVENFGLINRRDVADDVKALDQEARAALRRLGVRFGAFHVFTPALLKPGPAGLVTLLWSLAHDGKDKPGFGDVVNALASGRTSLVVDPGFEPAFYRLAGYRMLGRRAVRVDILERLADLIRPALSWRAGTGARPDGAYDGAAFLVTPAMMSILGATAEDMEEILKSLGYRAEAKPAAEVQARLGALDAAEAARVEAAAAAKAAAAEESASESPTGNGDETVGQDIAVEAAEAAPAGEEAVQAADETPEPAATDASAPDEAAPAAVETADATADAASEEMAQAAGEATGPAAADAPAPDEATPAAAEVAEAAPAQEEAAPDAAAETEAAAAEAPAEEAKPVLLWRPGRSEGRPRHGQGRRPPHGGGRQEGREAGAGDGQSRKRFERRFAGKGDGRGEGKAEGRENREDRDGQQRKGPHNGPNKGPHRGKPPHRGPGHGGPDGQGRNERQGEPRRPREDRPARIDPDSPFAKLAALREKLKGK
ncbi:MAG: helicase [Aquamicrobium sp.]|uniref:helicase-related protein n=1 Tax=Aquamicrobium sp. TaxID=1872579 RepID=UPI00349E8150|nr:helicase [Aquamicrobium sp.]